MWNSYGTVEYWNARYQSDPEAFEWFQSYKGIAHLLSPNHLTPNRPFSIEKENTVPTFPSKTKARVLIVGCGNSRFGEDMLKDGWLGGITNIDFSNVVIDAMKTRFENSDFLCKIETKLKRATNNKSNIVSTKDPVNTTPKGKVGFAGRSPFMEFECVDITLGLPYKNETYDLIICKGTMDAILCSPAAGSNVSVMMNECSRVLKKTGSMLVVSYGSPENRLQYFENRENEWWSGGIGVYRIPKPSVNGVPSKG
jgi:EEF1A lysine methyltransferase 4